MTQPIVTIVQSLATIQRPPDEKITCLISFACLRPLLQNCSFPTFVRTLEGPTADALNDFVGALTRANVPQETCANLLATYLDSLCAGAAWTPAQFLEKILGVQRKAEEDAFVGRVCAAPTNALPTEMHAAQQAVATPPANPAPGGGWGSVNVAAEAPPPEAQIPAEDPQPHWIRAGTRTMYEMGAQQLDGLIMAVHPRHVDVWVPGHAIYEQVGFAYVQPTTEPLVVETQVADDEEAIRAVLTQAAPDVKAGEVMHPIAWANFVSPQDGAPAYLSCDIVKDFSGKPACLWRMLAKDGASVLHGAPAADTFQPEWAFAFGGASIIWRLKFSPRPVVPTAPAAAPSKPKPKRTRTRKPARAKTEEASDESGK